MGRIYILLGAIAFYIFIDRMINVLLATGKSTPLQRVKTRVFVHSFMAPIILILAILLILLTGNKLSSIFLLSASSSQAWSGLFWAMGSIWLVWRSARPASILFT